MLPAFRIRNLNRSPAPPSRPVGSSPRKAASLDAVVRITSPEYDETVDRHPEASLKYLDDDDGEIVTVTLEIVGHWLSVLTSILGWLFSRAEGQT